MQYNEFNKLNLDSETIKNLDLLGYTEMTEIQAKALPEIFQGKDVVAQAQTGSGKTAAFGLGILAKIDTNNTAIQALVICPTRELAAQVATEIRKLARLEKNIKVLTLCGGTPLAPQAYSLEHGAHIVIGTPGRLTDHLGKNTLKLNTVKTLVLDEADRMLDMGFVDDIKAIINKTPRSRQTLLFSATFPDEISNLSEGIQRDPIHIKAKNSTNNLDIEQIFVATKKDERLDTLIALLADRKPKSCIVFCTTKVQCDEVASYLWKYGVVALPIHSDFDQKTRDEVIVRFSNLSASVLVATDVAARGLDVKDLEMVINYEISRDPEVHVHRVGRTGRAGKKGLALTIYNDSEEFRVKAVEEKMSNKFAREKQPAKFTSRRVDILPPMQTLKIFGGKKSKLRPGDILGALTKDSGIDGKKIGKINIFDFDSYVALSSDVAQQAFTSLTKSKIKNRTFGMKLI